MAHSSDPHIIGLAKLLGILPETLIELDSVATSRIGKSGVSEKLWEDIQGRIKEAQAVIGAENATKEATRQFLQQAVLEHEKQLLEFIGSGTQEQRFQDAVELVLTILRRPVGYFLKKEKGQEILRARPPQNVLKFLGYDTVEELFAHHDITETFSALRFMESTEWMHETFDAAYKSFTPDDFEEREIEMRVLGSEWNEVAEQFVIKKHHNVSHLKEFGVIFLNPVAEDAPGKFLRDFALLFHYGFEVEFYSNLFRIYAKESDFAQRLMSLLRGDVANASSAGPGEWLIVQRYLFKEDPSDARLSVPHLNPESLHWAKAETALAEFGRVHNLNIKMWGGLDWVGEAGEDNVITSYEMEDVLMSAIDSATKGTPLLLSYHMHEALWTQLFSRYVGGQEAMEALLLKHFADGIIKL